MPNIDSQKTAIIAVSDAFPHDGELTFRRMFGGICAYFNGRVFALITKLGLALKLREKHREQLLEEGGQIVQFGPDGPVMKNYIFVPEKLWAEESQFEAWAERSVKYVLELPPPKSRKKK
ncbi:TfoX family protein [bacterium]|nr:MAG: TfoX family protein [bacterium]